MVDEVMKFITEADPEVGEAIEAEAARQRRNLELIASENIVSEPVMMAMGSVLTNKYAEGYPGKRYYGGCQCVDVVESIAIERAKKLFGCEYVNVQPHSGAQANMAVFFAMLKPGDTVMGMNLAHGGHHGLAYQVLRRDQLQMASLSSQLILNGLRNFRIVCAYFFK